MTPQERLDHLLEPVFVPVNRAVLITDVSNLVGLEAAALVVGTLKQAAQVNPLFESVLIAMSSVGLFINTAERQGQIDQLAAAGQWPDELRDAVKSLGGVTVPRWQQKGYEAEPTLEQITDELHLAAMAEFADTLSQRVEAAIRLEAAKPDSSEESIRAVAIAEVG